MSDRASTPAGDPPETADRERVASVRAFYGRWSGLYDAVARRFPRIAAVRRAAADACRLSPGDTVLEVGCGTGANLPYLRERVGPGGRVLGLDVTRRGLVRARRATGRAGGSVDLLQADGTDPPVRGPVDAVLGSFVTGMFPDPAAVVDRWCDLAPGGHVVLVDAAPSDHPAAAPVNAAFRAAVVLSTPPTTRLRYDRDVAGELDRRVAAGRRALRERSTATAEAEYLAGLVRLTGGRVED